METAFYLPFIPFRKLKICICNVIDFFSNVRYNVRKEMRTIMTTTTITNFRKNVYSLVENTVRFNEPVNITTKDGNAVMISEEEYLGLLESLYLTSIPGMKEKLVEGLNTPLSETVPEEEVAW